MFGAFLAVIYFNIRIWNLKHDEWVETELTLSEVGSLLLSCCLRMRLSTACVWTDKQTQKNCRSSHSESELYPGYFGYFAKFVMDCFPGLPGKLHKMTSLANQGIPLSWLNGHAQIPFVTSRSRLYTTTVGPRWRNEEDTWIWKRKLLQNQNQWVSRNRKCRGSTLDEQKVSKV